MLGNYYVYALKDPRTNPARAFYIGKGTGDRVNQHLLRSGDSPKDKRIAAIREAGLEPLTEILVGDLREDQALRIEAELIAAFGTETTGGLLVNLVQPRGQGGRKRPEIVIPAGSREKAQVGLDLLLGTIMNCIEANRERGVTNADIAHELELQSDHLGAAKDYLSYSLLGVLLREHKIIKHSSRYFPAV